MSTAIERRSFLAWLAASLAVLFAPLREFFDGLPALIERVAEASDEAIDDAYEWRISGYYSLGCETPGYNLVGTW